MKDDGLTGRDGVTRDLYLIKSVVHAADVLAAFQHMGDALRLRDVMRSPSPAGF
jgi:hypothetical protein